MEIRSRIEGHGTRKRKAGYPAAYIRLVPALTRIARRAGYALAVHGSMARDLDLIAVPWTEAAVTPEELVCRFVDRTGGFLAPLESPALKPHGRLAYLIHLFGGAYIDLSVMPRKEMSGADDSDE